MTDGGRPTLADLAQVLGTVAPPHPLRTPWPVTGVTLDSRRVAPGDLYTPRCPGPTCTVPGSPRRRRPPGPWPSSPTRPAAPTPRPPACPSSSWTRPVPSSATSPAASTGTRGAPDDVRRHRGRTARRRRPTSWSRCGAARAGRRACSARSRPASPGERVSSVRARRPRRPDLHALLARMVAAGVGGCALEVSPTPLPSTASTASSSTSPPSQPVPGPPGLPRVDGGVPRRQGPAVHPAALPAGGRWTDPPPTPTGGAAASPSWPPCPSRPSARTVAGADWSVRDVHAERAQSSFRLTGPDDADLHLTSPLPGAFNVANAAVAAVAALRLGLTPSRGRGGPGARRGRARPHAGRRPRRRPSSSSTTRTRPTPSSACSPRCAAAPRAGSSRSWGPAGTATAASDPSWGRSWRGSPTSRSSPTTTRARRTRRRSGPRCSRAPGTPAAPPRSWRSGTAAPPWRRPWRTAPARTTPCCWPARATRPGRRSPGW